MSNQAMTKATLIAHLADQAGVGKTAAAAVLEALCDVVHTEVSSGKAVTLPGIGKITVRDRPARMVRNPSTGAQFEKAADRAVKITPLKALKDAVNA